MRKKSSRVNVWGDRYFVLRGSTLYYYLKSTDLAPKGNMPLTPNCKVSEIRSDVHKKRKQFVFRISWPLDESDQDKDLKKGTKPGKKNAKEEAGGADGDNNKSKSAISSSKLAAMAVGGVVIGAVTAGVGLLAGLVIVGIGAAAGGGASALYGDGKEYVLQLACDTYHEAEGWVFAIDNQIHSLGGNAEHTSKSLLPYLGGLRRGANVQAFNAPPPEVRLEEVEEWVKSSRWRVAEVWEGIRFMEQSCGDMVGGGVGNGDSVGAGSRKDTLNGGFGTPRTSSDTPCMRVTLPLNGSASDTFATVMNMPFNVRTGIFRSLRIVETIDYNSDVIHVTCQPMYLWPTWTSPRDLCLTRYWKQNSDGSFVVCLDSSYHVDCPLVENYARGELHAVYIIAPLKDGEDDEEQMECSVTFIAQYDPKGWVWQSCGYQRAMLRQLLFHVLDIRDCLDDERFIQVNDVEALYQHLVFQCCLLFVDCRMSVMDLFMYSVWYGLMSV